MEFTEFKPVLYLDSETSSVFLEEPVEIEVYRDVLGAPAEFALGEGEVRDKAGGSTSFAGGPAAVLQSGRCSAEHPTRR